MATDMRDALIVMRCLAKLQLARRLDPRSVDVQSSCREMAHARVSNCEPVSDTVHFYTNALIVQVALTCSKSSKRAHSHTANGPPMHIYRLCCPTCGTSFHGYLTSSSFLMKCFLLFLVVACSTIISRA